MLQGEFAGWSTDVARHYLVGHMMVYLMHQPLRVKALVEYIALITPLVALAASLAVILAIRYLDVVEREPKRLIALALILGAISTLPSIIWQAISATVWESLGAGESLVSSLTTVIDAPISDELFKGLALLIMILAQRRKLDSLTDYLIYACAVGIGFELIENILYQWSAFDQDNQVAGWVDEFNNRTLASAGSHAFFSVWLGLAGWILFQANSKAIKHLAAAALGLSMLLHSFNNLTAVMMEPGPEGVVLPINRLGTTLAVVSNHLTLALFIGLIGVAILRDVRFLIDFGSLIQTRLLRHAETPPSESLLILKDLTNPINHVMASSVWSWRWSRYEDKHLTKRSAYREFAKLALASAQRGPAASSEALVRSGCIDQGLKLIQGLA